MLGIPTSTYAYAAEHALCRICLKQDLLRMLGIPTSTYTYAAEHALRQISFKQELLRMLGIPTSTYAYAAGHALRQIIFRTHREMYFSPQAVAADRLLTFPAIWHASG